MLLSNNNNEYNTDTKIWKSNTKKANHWPVSVMVTNAKKPKLNVSKQPKLSVRIRQNIKITIHDVGFLLGMQVWLNIRKSINVTHHINRLREKNNMYDHFYRC